jgi:AcrR family transcriptional regulator
MPSPARGLSQPERVATSKRRLARAAADLILEKGWEATTSSEIGLRAGYSRGMVHARFGGKEALLDVVMDVYVEQLSPDLDPLSSGLDQALAHFDRIGQLATDDAQFLKAMFVAAFEAVKTTSPLRSRSLRQQLEGRQKVETGLRAGMADGSVRPDIDIADAVGDISSAVFGMAYQWLILGGDRDFTEDLAALRARILRTYGT